MQPGTRRDPFTSSLKYLPQSYHLPPTPRPYCQEQATALWSLNMSDYSDLKRRVAITTVLMVASGASLAALTGGTEAALPYAAGGVVGVWNRVPCISYPFPPICPCSRALLCVGFPMHDYLRSADWGRWSHEALWMAGSFALPFMRHARRHRQRTLSPPRHPCYSGFYRMNSDPRPQLTRDIRFGITCLGRLAADAA